METRQCKDCGEVKTLDLFRPKSRQCKACRKLYLQAYEFQNKEKRTAQKLQWAALNSEKSKEINRQTKLRNRDRVYEEVRKRRASKFNAEGSHTELEWRLLCESFGNICLCCRAAVSLTRDHVRPLSKGGTDWIENIQPLCRSCNSSKGARNDIDYRINFAL